jgi:steroid delta-isomerase-like uncharacterized protein
MPQESERPTIPEMVDHVRKGKFARRNFMKALTAIGISATGAGIVTTVAASNAFSVKKPLPVSHTAKEEAENLDLHSQHLTHQTQGNMTALQNDYAPHALVEDSMFQEAFVGHQAILQRKAIGMSALPDLQIKVLNRVAQGKQVVVEWEANGTHTGDLHGLVASGRPFAFRGVTVVVRENGKIVREAIYYNADEVKQQLSYI